jgi:hypothetical protein
MIGFTAKSANLYRNSRPAHSGHSEAPIQRDGCEARKSGSGRDEAGRTQGPTFLQALIRSRLLPARNGPNSAEIVIDVQKKWPRVLLASHQDCQTVGGLW